MRRRANDRQLERAMEDAKTLWCSVGRHKTWPTPEAKEHFSFGTMCIRHQLEVVKAMENFMPIPELSEAMKRNARMEWEKNRARAVAVAPLRNAAPTAEGVVYYMRIGGRIKIGYTTDLTKRSRAYPPDTELLAAEPGDRDLEHQRHMQFSRYLDRGREWFVEGIALRDHIADVASKYPVPSELMHRFTKHRGSNA